MMSFRASQIFLRIGAAPRAPMRALSTQAMRVPSAPPHRTEINHALLKFEGILNDYRTRNNGILFGSFVKQVVLTADSNHDGMISLDEMKRLLVDIGTKYELSAVELEAIMREFGQRDHQTQEFLIAVDNVEQLILSGSVTADKEAA